MRLLLGRRVGVGGRQHARPASSPGHLEGLLGWACGCGAKRHTLPATSTTSTQAGDDGQVELLVETCIAVDPHQSCALANT